MKRRCFLQQAGAMLTGATAAAAVDERGLLQHDTAPNDRRPTVLLTSPESELGQALADALGEPFDIRPAGGPLFRDENGALERLLQGVRAVIHVAQPDAAVAGGALIDRRGRGTYDLLTTAAAKGVELVVYLSSLRIMAGYDPSFQVAEDWRPVPNSDPDQLSHYLAECTCREFAREGKVRAVVLRLAEVVRDAAQREDGFEPPWVAQADAVQAVRRTLEVHFNVDAAALRAWNVLHIAADVPGGRFPVTRAKRVLGYRPRFNPQP